MYGLALVLLVANLPCVEGISKHDTCGWICTNDTDIDEKSRNMLANGSLVKFCVWYKEQVSGECAKQTVAKNSSASSSLWLKMAAGGKPRKKLQGRLELVTQTILEGIFGGHFASGAYKEINVSCVFKSTFIRKSGSNYSSERLTFHNLSSILYFVDREANYSTPSTIFLTLLRTDKNTSLSVGVTSTSGSLSSSKSAKDNELIVTNGWLAVAIIIWTVVLLYFPAMFILFQPSEIKLKVPRETREVQGDIRPAVPVEHEGSGDTESQPLQSVDMSTSPSPSQRNSDAPGSREGSERTECAGGNSLPNRIQPTDSEGTLRVPVQVSTGNDETYEGHGVGASPSSPAAEIKNPSDQDPEHTVPSLYKSKSLPHSYGGGATPSSTVVGTKNPSYQDSENTRTSRSRRLNVLSFCVCGGVKRPKEVQRGKITRDVPQALGNTNNTPGQITLHNTDPSDSHRNGAINSPSHVIDIPPSPTNEEVQLESGFQSQMELHDTDPNIPSASHNNDAIDGPLCVNDTHQRSPTNENVQQESDVQSLHGKEVAFITGETYPVGFGSWIGNKLFSTTHERNNASNIFKLIFMFCTLPLFLFLVLGDLFLVLLPHLQSRLSDHLPFAFLTRSLGYGIIDNHPHLLVLIVLSAIAYLIRLVCFCFLSRDTLEGAWHSCYVHRMHATCLACKLFQLFVSKLRSFLLSFSDLPLIIDLLLSSLSMDTGENCSSSVPLECSKYLDLPENISHNLEKQSDIFLKHWDSFCKCWSDVWETKSFTRLLKGIVFSLTIIILIITDICFSSPLVCLCHGRLWMLTQRCKNKFKWSRVILPVLEVLLMLLSLVWVTSFSLLCTIPLGVAIIGLIKVLGSHTNQMLPQATIAVVALYHFWSCYRSFRTPYRYVAKFLASRYQKKYDERENGAGVSSLIHYKQGDLKVIPKELFDDGCKEFKLSIKNDVALLLVKLVCTLLAFSFFFLILGPNSTTAIISFLAVAYGPINNAINWREFEIFEVEADKVVDDYVARKQRDSS